MDKERANIASEQAPLLGHVPTALLTSGKPPREKYLEDLNLLKIY